MKIKNYYYDVDKQMEWDYPEYSGFGELAPSRSFTTAEYNESAITTDKGERNEIHTSTDGRSRSD